MFVFLSGLVHLRTLPYSIQGYCDYYCYYHITIKSATEFRNVGDAAYAMSHAAAEACTQQLAAGRGHRYRLAAPSLQPDRGTGSGPAC